MENKTLLFVDDDLKPEATGPDGGYMWYYTEACREAGFQIRFASGVDDGLHTLAEKSEIDGIVLDLLMPFGRAIRSKKGNPFEAGLRLAERIRKLAESIPIVVLTNGNAVAPIEKLKKLPNVKHVLFKSETPPTVLVRVLAEMFTMKPKPVKGIEANDGQLWRGRIHGIKQAVVGKFLAAPDTLTTSEFLLLSDLSHGLIRSIVQDEKSGDPKAKSKSWERTNESLLSELMTSSNSNVRGKCLEELSARLFNSVPGFTAKTRRRTKTEEIDVFVLNDSDQAPWRDMGPALIGECKQWSAKCGTEEFNHFESKVRNRSGQCRCGFFISWNGFTDPFTQQRLRSSRENFLILLVEGKHIKEAVAKSNFPAVLYRLWEEAVLF